MNGVFVSSDSLSGAILEPRDWPEDTAEMIRYDRYTDAVNPEQINWGIWLVNYLVVPI